jgi:RHH-type rel operon transcriptional repressor/antitoxin RelB
VADLIDIEVPPAMRRAASTLAANLEADQRLGAMAECVTVYTFNYIRTQMTTTLSVRIDSATKKQLEALAKRARRSKSFLAAEAIAAYVEAEAWQLDEIQAGLQELDSGRAVAHGDVSKWLRSWGKKRERKAPRA